MVLAKRKSRERLGLDRRLDAAKKRLHRNVLVVALANKQARIAWSVLAHRHRRPIRGTARSLFTSGFCLISCFGMGAQHGPVAKRNMAFAKLYEVFARATLANEVARVPHPSREGEAR